MRSIQFDCPRSAAPHFVRAPEAAAPQVAVVLFHRAEQPVEQVLQPLLLTFADGSERSGILDEEGRAEVFIDESCDISFPNVDGARRA